MQQFLRSFPKTNHEVFFGIFRGLMVVGWLVELLALFSESWELFFALVPIVLTFKVVNDFITFLVLSATDHEQSIEQIER
jgi:hypothetical protein